MHVHVDIHIREVHHEVLNTHNDVVMLDILKMVDIKEAGEVLDIDIEDLVDVVVVDVVVVACLLLLSMSWLQLLPRSCCCLHS